MDDGALLDLARAARERAHAPYSDFPMGAAVLTSSGSMLPGALVENATEELSWGRMMHEEGRRQSIRKSYGGE